MQIRQYELFLFIQRNYHITILSDDEMIYYLNVISINKLFTKPYINGIMNYSFNGSTKT